jgi:hypothetical protein
MTSRGAAATLEPATTTGGPAVVAASPVPTVVIRLGDVLLPVARPADADEVALEPGARLGQVELRAVRWPGPPAGPGPPPVPIEGAREPAAPELGPAPAAATPTASATATSGPQLIGAVVAPFVDGSVAIDLDEGGTPTGSVRLEAAIGLPGARVAAFWYASSAWRPPTPIPVPTVAVDGTRLTIDVAADELSAMRLAGVGLEPIEDGRWVVPLPPALVAALGTEAEGVEPAGPELIGVDRVAAARASLADESHPSEREPLADPARALLEAILGVDLTALGVHVDPPAERAAAAAGVPAFTLGSDAYFGTGAYGTDRPDLARNLARAIAQALEGISQVVLPDESVPDPTQERATRAAAPPVAPAIPVAPPPPDPAAIVAEAATLASAEAAQVGEEQAPPEEEVAAAGAEAAVALEEIAGEGEAAPGEAVEAAAGEAGAAGEEEGQAAIELIMPPAPTEPGPAQQERLAGVSSGAGTAARRAAKLPSAEETTDAARGAVTEPVAETAARAESAVAEALGKREEPSPQIVALCERIRTSIRQRRPIDEDAAAKADTQKVAQEAGQSLNSNIESESEKVEGSYAPLSSPPAGTPALQPTPVETPPATVSPPAIGAEGGAPDAIPPEDLSLDADRDATTAGIESSGINQPSAQPIQEPPFTTVREGQAELATLAENGPAQVATRQQEAIDRSQQDMAALQLQAVETLNASRAATVGRVSGGQTKMVGSEEQQRAAISGQAQAIFAEAQAGVTAALQPLQAKAMGQWDAGIERLSTEFHDHLAMVKGWIDDRHSGVGGWFVSGWDRVTGLPDEITDEYTKAEKAFGDGVCDLLLRISSDVNTVIAAAEALIESARERINELFRDLPVGLRDWATQERARFNTQLDGLHEQAAAARTSFVEGVSQKAVAAVAEVQAEVEQLREEAKGLIGKIADAIQDFLDDPIRAIINGLLNLVGIPPPRFWALVDKIAQVISDIADDPESFINNLVDALRQGFQQFFDNFGFHVLQGFWEWLFSGLGSVGVQLPKDLSVGSLVTFALQVMGITWPNIRKILVKHIGEENVALIEQAWQLVSMLIEKGPSGILDMIKERLAPDVLLETILKAAVDYLVESLIKAVAVKLISMLNPAGAIYQAIQLIYTILKWIFQNAARIFSLVETVVGAMADVIAGNLAAVANAVEKALAMLIPPVIDFFAEWLGFGDLPIKIADVIKSLQEQVLAVIDQIIGWLVEQAKALLSALGLGGDEDEEAKAAEDDTELGKVVPFSAAGEAHSVSVDEDSGEAMVASAPIRVTDKLAGWESKAESFKAKKQEKAKKSIARARDLVNETNAKAASIAPAYQAAASSPGEPKEPLPDDSAVESAEVQLAAALRELYVLFEEEPNLVETFKDDLGRCHKDARPDIEVGLGKLAETNPELELAEWSQVRAELFNVGGPIEDSLKQPLHVGSGAYRSAGTVFAVQALELAAKQSARAPIKARTPEGRPEYLVTQKRYLKDPGDGAWGRAVRALQESIFTNSSPVADLQAAFVAKWEASTEVDPDLQAAVAAAGDVVEFMRAIAKDTVPQIPFATFKDKWDESANKKYLKDLFRGVHGGQHEWIPTNMIQRVVERAAAAEEAKHLYRWVDMHNEMRTDTAWVIFDPTYETQTLTPPGGGARPALTGHVGAVGYRFLPDEETRWLQGHQGPWHDRLRHAFDTGTTPAEVVTGMKQITEESVWEGADPGSAFWRRYYVKLSEGGGPKLMGDLGSKQAKRYADLIKQFEEWKSKWMT